MAFALALGTTGFFATRFVAHAIYWSQHRDEPVASWMTIGYVANSYEVQPALLLQAVGLPPNVRDRRTLAEIAITQGRDFETIRAALVSAITAARKETAQSPSSSYGAEP